MRVSIEMFLSLVLAKSHRHFNMASLFLSDLEVQMVGLIKIIIDPEAIMAESTAVCVYVLYTRHRIYSV
jgi:hypothetical protein